MQVGKHLNQSRPDTRLLDEIRLTSGNEQLRAILTNSDKLSEAYDEWTKIAVKIEERLPIWNDLQRLLKLADDSKEGQDAKQGAQVIENKRFLLYEPDMIMPLVESLESALRRGLLESCQQYCSEFERQMQLLNTDTYWQKLPKETCDNIKKRFEILPISNLLVGTRQELITELAAHSAKSWKDKTDALDRRFTQAREQAMKELEPKTQPIVIPKRLLKTDQEIDDWIEEVKKKLKEALTKGPIVLK